MSVQLICFATGRGEGRAKYDGGRKEEKERRIQARGARISAPAPQACDPKGIIKDQLRGGKCLDRPHSEPKYDSVKPV